MTVRREGKWETAWERLRYWIQDNGATALALGVVALILLGVILLTAWRPSGPMTEEDGEVIRFGIDSRSERIPAERNVFVIVRTARGRAEEISAHRESLVHCFRGSRIHLIRQAGSLTVAQHGCDPPAS